MNTGSRFVTADGWKDHGLSGLAKEVGAAAAVRIADRPKVKLFYPNTTTLVEIQIDQVTTEDDEQVRLVDFVDHRERIAAEQRRKEEAEQSAREEEERAL